MRLPFPLDLRVGTDIINCLRIYKTQNTNPKRLGNLAARILRQSELIDLDTRFPEWRDIESKNEIETKLITKWIGGRWAAKEAAKKAWDANLISWKDLKIVRCSDGKVEIICCSRHDNASDEGSLRVTEQVGQLSISHDGDFAIATVLATPLHKDIVVDLAKRVTDAKAKVTQQSPWAKAHQENDLKPVTPFTDENTSQVLDSLNQTPIRYFQKDFPTRKP